LKNEREESVVLETKQGCGNLGEYKRIFGFQLRFQP
jgi:hypothetical protein